jgi:hypothetical protein
MSNGVIVPIVLVLRYYGEQGTMLGRMELSWAEIECLIPELLRVSKDVQSFEVVAQVARSSWQYNISKIGTIHSAQEDFKGDRVLLGCCLFKCTRRSSVQLFKCTRSVQLSLPGQCSATQFWELHCLYLLIRKSHQKANHTPTTKLNNQYF